MLPLIAHTPSPPPPSIAARFEFNGFPNPRYRPGKFELAIEGGIRAFKDPRPQLLMVSSGERQVLFTQG